MKHHIKRRSGVADIAIEGAEERKKRHQMRLKKMATSNMKE